MTRIKASFNIKLILIVLITCTYYLLLACNNKEDNPPKPKRKFVLTNDSTFIGTWYGRVKIDKVDLRDSVTAYYSLYSKDSILYMYKDYWRGKPTARNESDSAILDFSIRYTGQLVKFTDSVSSRLNAIAIPTFWLDNFLRNDSLLFAYKGSGASDSGKLVKNMSFKNGIEEYYKINSDNSLSFIFESSTGLNIGKRDLYIRYSLQPYEYKKQD